MKEFTVKEVSMRMGISADSLRYYDKHGILSPQRRENHYRSYNEHDILKLEYLSVMKYAHFTLEEIKDMLTLIEGTPSQECKIKCLALLKRKRTELKNAIENYQKITKLLDQTIVASEDIEDFAEEQLVIDDIIHGIFNHIFGKESDHL